MALPAFYTYCSDAVVPAVASIKNALRHLMWEKVGIERTEDNLLQAKEQVEQLRQELQQIEMQPAPEVYQLQNLLTVASITINACLGRKESIGGHYMVQERVLV